jgi:hypothetical protein
MFNGKFLEDDKLPVLFEKSDIEVPLKVVKEPDFEVELLLDVNKTEEALDGENDSGDEDDDGEENNDSEEGDGLEKVDNGEDGDDVEKDEEAELEYKFITKAAFEDEELVTNVVDELVYSATNS